LTAGPEPVAAEQRTPQPSIDVDGRRPTDSLGTSAAVVAAVGVRHVFDKKHVALHGLDLSVPEGEFCTLLGPSGSGKTTLLRILAGLLQPTEGRVHIGGIDVTDLPVQRRNIGFVFQHYALFPHLNVEDNIAFPLRVRGMNRTTRSQKVAEVLSLVALVGMEKRYPGQLSGGQQQRVAIARALVFGPKVLLLDEPLGALDRRLRQQLGADLRRIQEEAATTAIYVTHDQEEAFLLSDTVVVMNHGRIHQVGPPPQVYGEPSDLFVATFLGDTNVLEGRVIAAAASGLALDVGGVRVDCTGGRDVRVGAQAKCSVRPEDVEIYAPADVPEGRCVLGTATVEQRVFLGSRFRLALRTASAHLVTEVPRGRLVPEVGQTFAVGWPVGTPVLIADSEPANLKD
jgi:ABC-type Fe3+/spermidine/putrescine transport system ATPase subunit